jgi:hypothetical protein
MAANTGNKRVATKHIRDGIKSNYKKKCNCEICDTELDLELHHYTTVSILLKQYARERNIPIRTDEEVLAMRDDFYQEYWTELVDYTVTLCAEHHKLLHKIYGREPSLASASKQETWVKRIRDKLLSTDAPSLNTVEVGNFSKLMTTAEPSFGSLLT